MKIKLGFIGNGNMGYAILKGLIGQGMLSGGETAVYDLAEPLRQRAKELGSVIAQTEGELISECEAVLLAVKPQHAKAILNQIGPAMEGKLLLSIVAGYDTKTIRSELGSESVRILRIMPNTPALVGEGVFALDQGTDASEEEKHLAEQWFSSIGDVCWIEEKLFPVITGLSGGGPAYVAMFIEALADAGVKYGLYRDAALRVAAKTVLGSAKLILDENLHPAVLKDQVCSPGGTTIEGVQALEERNFRAAVIHAVEESTRKAEKLV